MLKGQTASGKLIHHAHTAAHFLERGARLVGTMRAIYEGGRALAPLAAALL